MKTIVPVLILAVASLCATCSSVAAGFSSPRQQVSARVLYGLPLTADKVVVSAVSVKLTGWRVEALKIELGDYHVGYTFKYRVFAKSDAFETVLNYWPAGPVSYVANEKLRPMHSGWSGTYMSLGVAVDINDIQKPLPDEIIALMKLLEGTQGALFTAQVICEERF